MQFFSKDFYRPVFFLIQYLQRTCDGHTQCDVNFLKNTFYRPVLCPNSVLTEDMRRPYSVWCNKSRKYNYTPVVSPTPVCTEYMRRPYSVWCSFSQKYFLQTCFFVFQYLQRTCDGHTQCDAITLKKVSHTCCFSYFSFYTGHANAKLSVMQFFPKVLFTDLFVFVFQYLQRICDGHTQCDAITLENIITHLLFLLLRFAQSTCDGHTQCDAVFPKSTFYRPVLFRISVPTEDMRRPYSVWCNNSQKSLTYLLFLLLQFLQRTSERHTQSDAIFLKIILQTSSFC